jgi:hypothetical protein
MLFLDLPSVVSSSSKTYLRLRVLMGEAVNRRYPRREVNVAGELESRDGEDVGPVMEGCLQCDSRCRSL